MKQKTIDNISIACLVSGALIVLAIVAVYPMLDNQSQPQDTGCYISFRAKGNVSEGYQIFEGNSTQCAVLGAHCTELKGCVFDYSGTYWINWNFTKDGMPT
jgi:hypothetical protein